jgi:glutathione S-transferase
MERPYRLHGCTQSYFTRKLQAYFEYKRIPYLFRVFFGANPRIIEAGWRGGIPAVETPDGEFMWDSTAVIHHLERRVGDRSVQPPDPVARFLSYLIEDYCDEWLYRPAVGSRWFCEENTRVGAWELAREATRELPASAHQALAIITEHMRASCPRMGVTADNIESWVDEVIHPWLRALGAQLAARPYLFGGRPSLADFAAFGGNAAHFINDPLCRRWVDADGPAIVAHTHRLQQTEDEAFGEWAAAGDVPQTLIGVVADAGRIYLPWVSRATVDGNAELRFASGQRIAVEATPFLREARATLLARYVEHRCAALDAALERAGVLPYFADFTAQAGTIPDYRDPPRPALNRPFPTAGAE